MAAETGSKVQAVLYASGPLDCSVSVTPDEGVTWFGQSLTALDRPVEYAKLEFLTPELGFAAVGTQHSRAAARKNMLFFTHNGGQSWTAFGALPHFGTSHILSGFSMTPDGTAFLTLATGPEENWPLLYCSADSGASWQTAELPWDDCALAYLNHLSRAEQRPEGFYVLLTQLPYSGGNAAFFRPNGAKGRGAMPEMPSQMHDPRLQRDGPRAGCINRISTRPFFQAMLPPVISVFFPDWP